MLLSPLRPDVSVGVVFRGEASKDRVLGFRGSAFGAQCIRAGWFRRFPWSLREIVLFNSLRYHKFRQLVFSHKRILGLAQGPNRNPFSKLFSSSQRVLNCSLLPVSFPVFLNTNKLLTSKIQIPFL
ncbi:hypothetical protein [Leptospira kirschneri]|uniref:hypothetical protein n=1 Tax=Leptospira kirschneri TaxID=29507 RepID=UPI0009E27616|nr:hypothetical protein [Leptospira kirschneri]